MVALQDNDEQEGEDLEIPIRAPLRLFFLISFLFSWAFWTPSVLAHFGVLRMRLSPTGPLQLLGDFGPTVGALAVAARDRSVLRQLGLALHRGRLPLRWFAASLFMPTAIMLGASVMRATVLHVPLHATLERIWRPAFLPSGAATTVVAILGFAMGMFIFAAAEEIGWRGFALPRLIQNAGFLPAGVFLGIMWALWHLPLAFVDGNPLQGESFLLFTASVILSSLLMACIWVQSSSLLSVILFHTAGNFTFFLIQPTPTTGMRSAATLVCILFIAFFGRPVWFDQSRDNRPDAPSTGARSTGA